MKTTYFKIDRNIQNHWLWSDKPFTKGQAWIDLLLLATHTDHKSLLDGKVINKKRGEVHVSIGFLADRWGWSRNKVYRYIDLLKSEKMVTSNGTTDGTVITIEKYAFYQSDYTTDGTTNGTPGGTRAEQQTEQGRNTNNKGYKGIKRTIKDEKDFINRPNLSEDAKRKFMEIRKKVREDHERVQSIQ